MFSCSFVKRYKMYLQEYYILIRHIFCACPKPGPKFPTSNLSVLLVEEAGIHGENHQVTDKFYHIMFH